MHMRKYLFLPFTHFRIICVFLLMTGVSVVFGQTVSHPSGYAAMNGGTTGGGNATPDTVTTADDFKAVATQDTPAVIVVQGKLNVGEVNIGSNKTIIGADTESGLYGGVIKVKGRNDIFQNLIIGPSGDGDDGMELSGATNIYITKCEFYDGADGNLDIVRQSDYVTVSWCKFYYVNQTTHKNTLMIGNRDDATADRGKLHVTLHHNWFAEKCNSRMPRVRFGHVHIYNNYYNSVGNNYCIGIGVECNIRLENTLFDNINDPWADYGGRDNGKLGWSGLKFVNCTQPTFMPNTYPVFDVPYPYTLDSVDHVEAIVRSCAGNVFNANCSDTTYIPPPYYTLSIFKRGRGSISPSSGSYPADTTIALTAIAEEGWQFDQWSGDVSGTDNPLSVTMNSNKSITAKFVEITTESVSKPHSVCRIYPNPVQDRLNIELGNNSLSGSVLRMFDHTGRILREETIQGTRHMLDLGSLSPGMYILSISDRNKVFRIGHISKQ